MPSMRDLDKTPRRALHIFYVLDTSGSMTGTPITTLNDAMASTVNQIKQLAETNADAIVKIAVLEFNSGCRWIQPKGPEELDDFYWQPLEAGGMTDMGAALKELDSKLSQDAFLNSMTGAYLPVIIFMTDGYENVNANEYERALERIRRNKWFDRGTKIGFALGEEADVGMISEIVGSRAVIQTMDLELFAQQIKFVSVTATMLCSTSHTSDDAVDGGVIVDQMKEAFDIWPEDPPVPDTEDGGDASDRQDAPGQQETPPDPFEWEPSME
ncbi:MAG: VWA domain-containing protein [Lachnospiraceae bacterium]|nr:VWA domain-containing protein [Lachnospiraceae bacterium]